MTPKQEPVTLRKLGIYYRCSTSHQDIDSQETAMRIWIDDNVKEKPESILIYKDKMSGKKDHRPGLDQLMKDCADGKVDTVLVYKLDRLSRRSNFAIQTILRWAEANIHFVAVTQPMLDLRPSNKCRNTILGVLADFAELEREQMLERQMHGYMAAKERGVKFGRPKQIDLVVMQKIHELKAKGLSSPKIAAELGIAASTVRVNLMFERRKQNEKTTSNINS